MVILVFLFFLLFAATVTVVGDAELVGTGTGEEATRGAETLLLGIDADTLASMKCSVRSTPSILTLEFDGLRDSTDDTEASRRVFNQGFATPTSFGENCLEPICDGLVEGMLNGDFSQVEIVGHSSPEWENDIKGVCFNKVRTQAFSACLSCSDDAMCNRILSHWRAVSILNFCYGRINQDVSIPIEMDLNDALEIYLEDVLASGAGSREPLFVEGSATIVDEEGSRRVEFIVRP